MHTGALRSHIHSSVPLILGQLLTIVTIVRARSEVGFISLEVNASLVLVFIRFLVALVSHNQTTLITASSCNMEKV